MLQILYRLQSRDESKKKINASKNFQNSRTMVVFVSIFLFNYGDCYTSASLEDTSA